MHRTSAFAICAVLLSVHDNYQIRTRFDMDQARIYSSSYKRAAIGMADVPAAVQLLRSFIQER